MISMQELQELSKRAARDPLPDLDGEAAPETQAIARAIGATVLALNRWWVLTPRSWICPSCKRGKAEIARINRHGEMMGEMHAHHDHIGDLILRRFHEVSAVRGEVVADDAAQSFVSRAAPLVSAYDETVICADCNGADGKAKRLVPTHPDFSFSPREIGQFVISAPNREHDIDVDRARTIWRDRIPIFEARLRIIEQIVEMGSSNEHWFQPSDNWDRPDGIYLTAQVALNRAGYNMAGNVTAYTDGARSVRKPVRDLSAWRKRRPGRTKVPTPGQIDHVAKVTHFAAWNRVPDKWTCPGCGRNKPAIAKPSAQFPWAIEIQETYFYDELMGRRKVVCCGDCNHACLALAKEAGLHRSSVSIEDVRDIVVPTPHAQHSFQDDTIVGPVIDRIRLRQAETAISGP
jgi:rubredoxin